MGFQKAVKSKSKLRAAMFGPSGSGKTYSALAIAMGMGKRAALMDSERSSASLYADRFDFDQVDLIDKTIDEYVFYINEAAKAGYDVLIIDSLSHAWEVLNEEVQRIADTSFAGNFWAAWSKGTPMQRKLIEAIVSFPGHIIATMRSKTEWHTGSDSNGKKSGPVRVGLAPEQGKGIEYEFTILFELSTEHLAHVIKDRTGKFQDKILEKPGKEFGEQLVAWLNEGEVQVKDGIKSVLLEIGNIVKSKAENGMPYFSEQEYDSIKAMCKTRPEQSQEARLEFLQNILGEQKKILQERIVQSEISSSTGPMPNSEIPPISAQQPESVQPHTETMEEKTGGWKATMNRLKEQSLLAEDAKTETTAVAPSEAGKGDDFDDDIPDDFREEGNALIAELDIF